MISHCIFMKKTPSQSFPNTCTYLPRTFREPLKRRSAPPYIISSRPFVSTSQRTAPDHGLCFFSTNGSGLSSRLHPRRFPGHRESPRSYASMAKRYKFHEPMLSLMATPAKRATPASVAATMAIKIPRFFRRCFSAFFL